MKLIFFKIVYILYIINEKYNIHTHTPQQKHEMTKNNTYIEGNVNEQIGHKNWEKELGHS